LHQVKIGNYMGQNFGVVVGVSESEITLRELVQDSAGDWVERTSTLMLQEKGAK
jgi:type IV pilus assembly protein PilP